MDKVSECQISYGREFHIEGAHTEKERSPIDVFVIFEAFKSLVSFVDWRVREGVYN